MCEKRRGQKHTAETRNTRHKTLETNRRSHSLNLSLEVSRHSPQFRFPSIDRDGAKISLTCGSCTEISLAVESVDGLRNRSEMVRVVCHQKKKREEKFTDL